MEFANKEYLLLLLLIIPYIIWYVCIVRVRWYDVACGISMDLLAEGVPRNMHRKILLRAYTMGGNRFHGLV